MRHLASIVQIASSTSHPNADRLSIATMTNNGWKVITARDEFKPGDLAIFFEIDAYLPADDERYAFLRDRCLRKFVSKSGKVLREGIRIKTCKLRGELSQGLLLPLDKFPEVTDQIVNFDGEDKFLLNVRVIDDGEKIESQGSVSADGVRSEASEASAATFDAFLPTPVVGVDVTSLLRVEHYDEIKAALAPECGCPSVPSDAKMSDFPTHLCPKSDEDRIQIHPEYFSALRGRKFEVTEKKDGQSITFISSSRLDTEPFAVCSRNMRLKRQTEKGVVPLPWKICADFDAERKISDYCSSHSGELAFQGELQGAGINSNRDMLPSFKWQVFKVFDCQRYRYLNPIEAKKICSTLGFEYVPVLAESMPFFDVITTMEDALKFAEGKTERGNEREGVVLKSCDDGPFRSFKIVSNKYLLGQKD